MIVNIAIKLEFVDLVNFLFIFIYSQTCI